MTLSSGPGLQYQDFLQTTTCFGNHTYRSAIGGWQKQTTGVDTPNFHKLKRSGALLPITQFTQTEWSLTRSGNYYYSDGNNCHCTGPGVIPVGERGGFQYKPSEVHVTDLVASVDTTLLLQNAVANLNAEFDALTFAAELKHLPELLLGAARRLLNIVSHPSARKLANGWLEWRYGWKPLYGDLVAIKNLIDDYNQKHGDFVRKRSSSAIAQTFTDVVTASLNLSEAAFDESTQVDSHIGVSGRATVVSKIRPPKMLTSPLVTGWELIPYSFVIDWLLSIGNSLRAMAAASVHKDMVTGIGVLVTIQATGSGSWTATRGIANLSYTSVYSEDRTWRTPQSVSFTPRFKLRFDAYKALDLLAMICQRILSRR